MSNCILKEDSSKMPECMISTVSSVLSIELKIPEYQRPYKWTAKNVNQLINDLILYKNKNQYRLGTLVLYNNDIVDGQQRIITLILLLHVMCKSLEEDKITVPQDISKKIRHFANAFQFGNKYSLHNIVENIHIIESRKSDFNKQLLEFLLNNCEFVVVQLYTISEAFQFFDSQNARGKDLVAHDLLKAYHLREIQKLTEEDSHNITEWQNHNTQYLKNIFLTLYRAKRWSKGKEARYFTKDDIDLFKGISLNDDKQYPFYQLEVLAHNFANAYNSDAMRIIDKNRMSYPFNLDDQIINGSRFFDMIVHYMTLIKRIHEYKNILPEGNAKDIMDLLPKYEGEWRTGDGYVREMFYTLLLYYIDRFGEEELDKVIPQLFIWAYKLRLEHTAIHLATIDNYALESNSMFRIVFDAKDPYDIINTYIEGIKSKQCTKCKEIIDLFIKYNKYYGNK